MASETTTAEPMSDEEILQTAAVIVRDYALRAPEGVLYVDTPGQPHLDDALAAIEEACELEYIDEFVDLVENFDDVDDIVTSSGVPRGGGIASDYYYGLRAIRLPGGGSLYFESGDWDAFRFVAASASEHDVDVARRFGEFKVFPTFFHPLDTVTEIDIHLGYIKPGSWSLEQLLEDDPAWLDYDAIDEARIRQAQIENAVADSEDEGDVDEEILEAQQGLLEVPPWFLLLDEEDLDEIATLRQPDPEEDLSHIRHPWRRPTPADFADLGDPEKLQHVVAAYVVSR